jgi:hypothetical protein
MIDSQTILRVLLNYLEESEVLFTRVSSDSMKDKAVAEFSFDLSAPACIMCGHFQDKTKELISIAHEFGHVMIYKKMNREKTRDYLCTMFAANKMGANKISLSGQEVILEVEAEASVNALDILKDIGLEDGDLSAVKKMMSLWYATYEKSCWKDVAKKVREKLIKDKNYSFLLKGLPRPD